MEIEFRVIVSNLNVKIGEETFKEREAALEYASIMSRAYDCRVKKVEITDLGETDING